jgi:hypothetical protein
MEKITSKYKKIKKLLPKPIVTKLDNINKERGGDGMYTVRNSPYGTVLLEEITFKKSYNSDWEKLNSIFTNGYRVILKPEVYFSSEIYKGFEDRIIVIYRNHSELEKFPYDEKYLTIKKNKSVSGFVVVDIRDMDSKKNNSIYLGAKCIGRPDMEFATKEEILKIQLCNLYVVSKIENVFNCLSDDVVNLLKEYQNEFEKTKLFTDNENLIKFTRNHSVCPDTGIPLRFEDLIDGTQESDEGRDKWMITTTKINLHHVKKRKPGELNHNHKNVFFGSAIGNTLDITLPPNDPKSRDIMIQRLSWQYGIEINKK